MAALIAESTSAAEPVREIPILEPLITQGSATLSIGEVVRLAFDSLRANKVRALLTMLGVIIGVASVVTLMALGGGASNAITEIGRAHV